MPRKLGNLVSEEEERGSPVSYRRFHGTKDARGVDLSDIRLEEMPQGWIDDAPDITVREVLGGRCDKSRCA